MILSSLYARFTVLRALGWDVENKKGFMIYCAIWFEVESRIDEQGSKKRADYLFRTDGLDRFVCEEKKPASI